ncbi:MAG TPA: hypothetical protein VGE02_01110 [Gemmatimonadales bacterium]
MSVILVCPVCSMPLKVERLPGPVACPECFQPFPEAARSAVTRELESPPKAGEGRLPRPSLLTVWLGVETLNVGRLLLMLVGSAVVPAPLRVNGTELSATAFLLRFFLPTVGTTLLTMAVVYGIWKERAWTRRVLLASWLWIAASVAIYTFATPVSPPGVSYPAGFALWMQVSRLGGVLLPLAGFAASAWYLYRKPNVVAYFAAIERARARR